VPAWGGMQLAKALSTELARVHRDWIPDSIHPGQFRAVRQCCLGADLGTARNWRHRPFFRLKTGLTVTTKVGDSNELGVCGCPVVAGWLFPPQCVRKR
jgi:hypothetical protein